MASYHFHLTQVKRSRGQSVIAQAAYRSGEKLYSKANNVYVWHSGHDKEDCYYKNLYPLNQEQFRIVNNHFQKTGDDSEQFILNVMNDIRYKPDNWSIFSFMLLKFIQK